jgi:hypothetical protein
VKGTIRERQSASCIPQGFKSLRRRTQVTPWYSCGMVISVLPRTLRIEKCIQEPLEEAGSVILGALFELKEEAARDEGCRIADGSTIAAAQTGAESTDNRA